MRGGGDLRCDGGGSRFLVLLKTGSAQEGLSETWFLGWALELVLCMRLGVG